MRVVYDHQAFVQRYGGVSRYFVELASKLDSSGIDVRINSPVYLSNYLAEMKSRKIVNGIYLPYHFRGIGYLTRVVNKTLLKLLPFKSADILHETYYIEEPLIRSKKNVITVYDMVAEKFCSSFPHGAKFHAIKKMSIERADHVICISKQTLDDLIDMFGVNKEKVSVIYLGSSLSNGTDCTEKMSSDIRPYVLYVGKRNSYKNFDSFIKAYALSDRVKKEADVVCFGGGTFSDEEIKTLDQLGVCHLVKHVTGDDKTLARYYKNAVFFVYPSIYEGFGLPTLEAMNFGCPVVCSNTSSLPEVVGDAGFYFDPANLDEIKAAIETMVFDSGIRNRLVMNGFERVKKFTWEKTARETAKLYRSLLV